MQRVSLSVQNMGHMKSWGGPCSPFDMNVFFGVFFVFF